jgi:hypothetical protein
VPGSKAPKCGVYLLPVSQSVFLKTFFGRFNPKRPLGENGAREGELASEL